MKLYDCANRDRCGPQWLRWKEQGRCQHESYRDPRCAGCAHQRLTSTHVPLDGTGGVK